jgi:hypothetical protein
MGRTLAIAGLAFAALALAPAGARADGLPLSGIERGEAWTLVSVTAGALMLGGAAIVGRRRGGVLRSRRRRARVYSGH